MMRSSPCCRLASRAFVLCGICMAEMSATAAPVESSHNHHWQDLLTNKVIICGVAAVALLLLSLLLRGILKLISIALVLVLAAGMFWFVRDAWSHRSELLPREWLETADKTLQSPKAKEAWRSVQSELSHLSSDARKRLAIGTDDARRSLLGRLESKSRELRKAGNTTEAEELLRLRELLIAQK